MADSNKNGENYEDKNKWVWVVILIIAVKCNLYDVKDFYSGALAVSVVAFN